MGEEENRQSVDIFAQEQLKLAFPRKSKLPLADFPVIIMSMTHHAHIMRVEAFVIGRKCTNHDTYYSNLHKKITSIESAANL